MIHPRSARGRFILGVPGLLLIAGAVLLVSPALAKKKDKGGDLERYTARAYVAGNIAAGQTSLVDIAISRWSTDEQREQLLGVLAEEGADQLVKALQDQPEAGWFKIGTGLRIVIRYARELPHDDGRLIRLVTDRPIGFGETARMSRTLDYNITIIELLVDDEGRGSGALVAGVEVDFDKETGTLQLKNFSTKPVQLTSVRRPK